MSFARYPEYKDSGVEWLGYIPATWRISRVRNLFEICKRIVGTEGFDVLSITQRGIKVKDTESGDGQLSMDYSKYQLVEVGDFAMNHMDLLTGYVDISIQEGVTSPDYRVFRLRDHTSSLDRYFLYLFQNAYKQRIFFPFGQGSSHLGRWRLPTDEFNAFQLPCPSLDEQHGITSFLDRETAKIDALVAEQERLIELLKEKRQAVISHAVTKGLDPDVPMKDSGVEWLGEVPAHWEVVRLKRAVMFQRGHDLPEESRTEGEFPVVSSAGVIGTHDTAQAKGPGIVTGRYGSIGRFTLMEEDYWPLNTALYSIELYDNQPRYIWYLLQSASEHFVLNSLKSAVPGVDRNDIHVVQVAVPARREQEQIALYLDRHCSTSDKLVEQAEDAIALLQERRAALISAAVTGQIDVRGQIEQPVMVATA